MSPLVKKALAALAIKEGVERIQEMRRPKPTLRDRIGSPLILLILGGGVFYLFKTGRLRPVIEQAKGLLGSGDEADSTSAWEPPSGSNGASTAGSTTTTV